MTKQTGHVLWLSEVTKEDSSLVGRKGANLGEMVHAGFPVPDGFVISAPAYFRFIKENNLTTKITHIISTVDYTRPESIFEASTYIKRYILQGKISDDLIGEVFSGYKRLSGMFVDATVAIRSSATAEDLPDASFAGQQETFLNISGEANIMQKIKEAWASLFEARAIFYRHEKQFSHFKIGTAVIVQRMLASEQSGIMFTLDPVTNDRSKIVIEAIYGLGEYVVQGHVTPDHYEVSKKDSLLLKKTISYQTVQLMKFGKKNKEISLSETIGKRQKISDIQIRTLADLGKKLEKHYYFPQDCEWAIEKRKVYIVQTRPITTTGKINQADTIDNQPIASGIPGAPGIATGPVRVITSPHNLEKVTSGEILITEQIDKSANDTLKKVSAVVSEKGGKMSPAAILARGIGIPVVVGVNNITKLVKSGQIVTVNGTKGTIGNAKYPPIIHHPASELKTVTKRYVTLDHPQIVESVAQQNTDGIGLLDAQLLIASLGIHPKKLIHDGKKSVLVNTLTEYVEACAKAFHPRPVLYKAADFTSNEYHALLGGKSYEPVEPDPLLGYHGAFRFTHDPELFKMELEIVSLLRTKADLKNISLTIPFVRSIRELVEIKKIISSAGLYRSPSFELWLGLEVPSNIFFLEEFIKNGIDGVAIGSDRLTSLLLGVDKHNDEVVTCYDELNPSVLAAYKQIIETAHKHKIPTNIYGHAPSLYTSLVQNLVEWGITAITVSPDAIETVKETIVQTERKLILKKRI